MTIYSVIEGKPNITDKMIGCTLAKRKNDTNNLYMVVVYKTNCKYIYATIPLIKDCIHYIGDSSLYTKEELLKKFNLITITDKSETRNTLCKLLKDIKIKEDK